MRCFKGVHRRFGWFGAILLGFACWLAWSGEACLAVDADILLRGGTIYDGTGSEGTVGDVAVRGERIVAVGKFDVGKVDREIDCTGLIVAPGFIDLHTHCDGTILSSATRDNLNYLTQGCTTVVTGNCGGGKGDIAKFLDDIDRNGAGTNIAHLIPQGNVRGAVLGQQLRPATAEEIAKMHKLIDDGMRAGAWGMSTGLIYAPGCHAKVDEIAELAKRVAAHGGIYATHLRSEEDRLIEAIEEALEVGRLAKIPVHIAHFKSNGKPNWGHLRDAVALINQAREEGLVVTADQYPYVACATSLDSLLLPHDRIPEGRYNVVKRMKADPEFDKAIRDLIRSQLSLTRTIALSACKTPEWRGRHLAEIAESENMDVVDLVVKLHEQGGAKAVSFSMSEDDVLFGMTVPWVATGSDGAGHVAKPGAAMHPRSFGAFPRKIGLYSMQKKALPLAQAVRSCSGLPADIFGLSERGYLREGNWADVVVFDPKTYIDQATFEEPAVLSTGVRYLLLAGNPAIDQGEPSKQLYGRALRHKSTLSPDE
ncbi:MAG: D-aminoacylase [Planctomycetaceae bacterium]|nr:D-aminoacylase [Planctomycetaceae bacterium]